MSKAEKLLVRLMSCPKDLTWDELVSALRHLGYEEVIIGKTGGSRRRFVNTAGHVLATPHKPHPGNIVKLYAVKEIVAAIKALKGK